MPQRKISWAIGEIMQKSFRWMKDKNISGRAQYFDETQRNQLIDESVVSDEIPDNIQVVANLDIALPQDQLQQANIVTLLQGFMSNRWLREKVLGHGQSDQMTQEIWGEQVGEMKYQEFVTRELQKEQGVPPGGPGSELPPGGLPNDFMGPGGGGGEPPNLVQPEDVNPNPFPPLQPIPPIPPPDRQPPRNV
jgi:hypothetical protein